MLGPLPEGREYIAGTNRHFAKVCGTVTAYSADDMRAYAAKEVAAERERCLNEWNGLLLELRQMADDSADRGDVFAQRVVALLSRA